MCLSYYVEGDSHLWHEMCIFISQSPNLCSMTADDNNRGKHTNIFIGDMYYSRRLLPILIYAFLACNHIAMSNKQCEMTQCITGMTYSETLTEVI